MRRSRGREQQPDSAVPPPDRVRVAAKNLDFMRANLILPLLQRDLFSSFRQDILMVEAQIERGFVYTIREVEVMLMHHVLVGSAPEL